VNKITLPWASHLKILLCYLEKNPVKMLKRELPLTSLPETGVPEIIATENYLSKPTRSIEKNMFKICPKQISIGFPGKEILRKLV